MSAAHRWSSTARRSTLTATAAGTLLCALWFVPSANATQDTSGQQQTSTTVTQASTNTNTDANTYSDTDSDSDSGSGTESTSLDAQLADTGSIDTTPYLVGGTLFLGLGAGFVAYSVRRERMTAY
ncbi:LPXTG cell wall anchor domain-containing protein [Streptomyces avermitilis]|uniref:LPXTG cell wall anchor domain-containing protein n=1 Tax=Streptomyces avermitilis TaxID=33903 RepID=UPI0033C4F070